MAENKYGVAKKQWKKWNEQEQQAFLDLYESMWESPELYQHPKHLHDIPSEVWETITWNAAWMSAEFLKFNRKFND